MPYGEYSIACKDDIAITRLKTELLCCLGNAVEEFYDKSINIAYSLIECYSSLIAYSSVTTSDSNTHYCHFFTFTVHFSTFDAAYKF